MRFETLLDRRQVLRLREGGKKSKVSDHLSLDIQVWSDNDSIYDYNLNYCLLQASGSRQLVAGREPPVGPWSCRMLPLRLFRVLLSTRLGLMLVSNIGLALGQGSVSKLPILLRLS